MVLLKKNYQVQRTEKSNNYKEIGVTYSSGGYIGWDGVEVLEGGGGTPDSEVDGQEEAAQDDGERPDHQGEEDVLLVEGGVPTLPGGGALGGQGAVGAGVGG